VVLPVGVSAGSDSADFVGKHDYDTRHRQRIHFVWTADSGSLDDATRIASHEIIESVTEPEGSAIVGGAGTCAQAGWCEIADICPDTGAALNGVAVARYWSEHADTCITPDLASTYLRPQPSVTPPRDF
jgi:hypothetical protein